MTIMTGTNCEAMRNFISTHTHIHTHTSFSTSRLSLFWGFVLIFASPPPSLIPSDGKYTAVHTPSTQASPPSGGSRGSCKRVRHPETTSTASKRAAARELPGGAVTMPEIDGRKTPVKGESSMKTEVQVSL